MLRRPATETRTSPGWVAVSPRRARGPNGVPGESQRKMKHHFRNKLLEPKSASINTNPIPGQGDPGGGVGGTGVAVSVTVGVCAVAVGVDASVGVGEGVVAMPVSNSYEPMSQSAEPSPLPSTGRMKPR